MTYSAANEFTDGAGANDSGASFIVEFPTSNTEVWVRYRIFFPQDFDFGRGGKLPGLTGGTFPTGSTDATGFNGFSNRMMWRSVNSAGLSSGRATAPLGSANLVYLTTHPNAIANVNDEEENFRWIDPASTYTDPDTGELDQWVQVTTGTWHTITQQVVINTPGQNDGIIRGWWDGVLMSEETDLGFRDDSSFAVDQFYFSTFFGGGNSSWAPATDQNIYFDDFLVTTAPFFTEDPILLFEKVPPDLVKVSWDNQGYFWTLTSTDDPDFSNSVVRPTDVVEGRRVLFTVPNEQEFFRLER